MAYSQSKDTDETGNKPDGGYKRGLGIRHLQVAVISVAAFFAYSLWTNLSVAIVAMVDKSNNTTTNSSPTETFDWDETTQGYVLSSYLWGYVILQIPAGMLSSKYGGHRFLSASILISGILNLALPQCAFSGGWPLVCVNRVLLGLAQCFVFPAIYSMLGVWVPPVERSSLASVAISAQLLGSVVSTPLTGYLISAYGWPVAFYVLGMGGIVFGVIMTFLGADSPSKHRMISQAEKTYIQSSLGGGSKVKQAVPWKKASTSVPFLTAVFVMSSFDVVSMMFLTKLPTYLGTVMKFSIIDNGFLSALPYLVSWLLSFVFSWLCGFVVGREIIHISTARKIFNSIGHFGSALFIILMAHAEGTVLPVVYLTFAVGLQSGSFTGVQSTFVDLAPNFSGAIFSVANCVDCACSMFSPNVVGLIVTETGSVSQWRIVFYLCAFLLALSNIVFIVWGTAETQFWNWPDKFKNKDEYELSKKAGKPQTKDEPIRRYSLHGAQLME